MRLPYVGTLTDYSHQWVTATTMLFTENWLEDGLINDNALMLQRPSSIFYPDTAGRLPYTSYLPGAPLMIYALKQLLPHVDILTIIHCLNMTSQYMIACTLAVMVLILFPQRTAVHFLFSALAAVTYIVHWQPMYYHAMVFFADMAVLLPFCMLILCETCLQLYPRHRNTLHLFEGALLTFCLFLDWLGIFAMFTLVCMRIIHALIVKKPVKDTCFEVGILLLGPLLVLLFWGWQVHVSGTYGFIMDRFHVRYHFKANALDLQQRTTRLLQEGLFFNHLTRYESYLIYGSFIYFLWQLLFGRRKYVAYIAVILCMSCFLQSAIFPGHTVDHEFSVIKYRLILSFVVFGLLPLSLIERFCPLRTQYAASCRGIMAASCLFTLSPLVNTQESWQHNYLLAASNKETVAYWLRAHAGNHDVYIGKSFLIHFMGPAHKSSPHLTAISRQVVPNRSVMPELRAVIDSLPPHIKLHAILNEQEIRSCNIPPGLIQASIQDYKIVWHIVALNTQALAENQISCLTSPAKTANKGVT